MQATPVARHSAAIATGVVFGGVVPTYLIASLAVSIRSDFPFSETQLGLASALCFLLSALVSPWAGAIVSRFGIERGIYISTAMVAGSCLVFAFLVESALGVIVVMAVIGLGTGMAAPCCSAMLARDVDPRRQGTAFGMLTSAPQAGAFAAGLALPLIAHPFGWRAAFMFAAILSVFFALFVTRPRAAPVAPTRTSLRPPRHQRHGLALAAVASGFASAGGLGMRYFLVIFAIESGFSETGAGLLLSGGAFIAIFSRFGIGVLGDRHPGDAFRRAAALMLICVLGFALMAIGGKAWIIVGAMLAGGLGWGWQSPLSLGVVERNRESAAHAIGLQMSGFFSGAVIGPLLVGLWAEHGRYTEAWITCAGLAATAAVIAVLAGRFGDDPGERAP